MGKLDEIHKDIRNPLHYDMVLNTGFMSIGDCTEMTSDSTGAISTGPTPT